MRLISLTLLILLSFEVYSYNFTDDFNDGIFWGSFPVTFSRYALDETQTEELQTLTEEAEREWEREVGSDLWSFASSIQIGSGAAPNNNIRWSDNFADETGYDPSRTLAVTIRYNNGTVFSKVEIILNGNHPELRANTNSMLRNTILHELGHTLGLDHSNEHAIMAAYMNDLRSLQQDDVDGGSSIYNENVYRQTVTGFDSQKSGDRNSIGSCGTVELISGRGDGGSGASCFLLSILLGILISYAVKLQAFVALPELV